MRRPRPNHWSVKRLLTLACNPSAQYGREQRWASRQQAPACSWRGGSSGNTEVGSWLSLKHLPFYGLRPLVVRTEETNTPARMLLTPPSPTRRPAPSCRTPARPCTAVPETLQPTEAPAETRSQAAGRAVPHGDLYSTPCRILVGDGRAHCSLLPPSLQHRRPHRAWPGMPYGALARVRVGRGPASPL